MQSNSFNRLIKALSSSPPNKNVQQFMKGVAEIIKSNLECYFVGIFLVAEQNDKLNFYVGSGFAGEELARRKWQIAMNNPIMESTTLNGQISLVNLGAQKLVSYEILDTLSGNKAVIEKEVKSLFFPAPLLPDTRWLLYLPMKN